MNIAELTERVEKISHGYAEQFGIDRTDEWFILKLQEEMGELVQAFIDLKGMGRERGLSAQQKDTALAAECADVLGMLLLLARNEDVDMNQAMQDKWLQHEVL